VKKLVTTLIITAVAAITACSFTASKTDTLAEVKKKGVLIAGVRNSIPPFSYIDEKTGFIIGYDIDFVTALAKKLGVRIELKQVPPADRIKLLLAGDIDIIAATMTKTPERTKQIDFSHTYFFTGQKFITEKGTFKKLEDLEGKRIGTAKGSSAEQNIKKALPAATVLTYDDYPQAFLALQQGEVQAVTTDEAILAGMLAKSPQKDKFEIPNVQLSEEPYGLGMRKGDKKFVDFVNKTILEMEKSGEARRIFNKWFGPQTDFQLYRTFRITADK
jgi:polar amino acid transport system substrate-binding protein